jgi:Family of unknown function (DUF6502)
MSRRRSKIPEKGTSQGEIGPRAFLEPLARILNVSGCHPSELQREFARICRDLPPPKRAWEPMRPGYIADLSHVIARWHADERYVDADGRPVPLPLDGPAPSLKELISRVVPSIDPAQSVQWLMELKGIRRQGKLFLPTDKYLPFNRLPVAAWAHGLAAVLGMLRTVEHNVSAPTQKRLLERTAINPRFPVRALPQFHRELKRQAAEILWRFDADMRREELRYQREPVTRLCIGLYAFEDPVVTENGRSASRRGSAKRRSKRRAPRRRT